MLMSRTNYNNNRKKNHSYDHQSYTCRVPITNIKYVEFPPLENDINDP